MEKEYLNEKVFAKALEVCFKNDKIDEPTILLYKAIVDNMLKSKFYNRYPQDVKLDMQNTAYYFFLKYWRGYNPKHGKAFSYFTRTCQNAFRQEIAKYYKHNKNFDEIYNKIKQNVFDNEEGYDNDYDK